MLVSKPLSEIIDAIEKNGYPQITGQYVVYDEETKVIGACALGQAGLNLGSEGTHLFSALHLYGPPGINNNIFRMNDALGMSCKEIAEGLRIQYSGYLDAPIHYYVDEKVSEAPDL